MGGINMDERLGVECSHVYETQNGDIKLVTGCPDFSVKVYDVKRGMGLIFIFISHLTIY